MSFVRTGMSLVCHLYVLMCRLYVTCVCLYVMVYHSNALVCHWYPTRIYSYVISMLLVCTHMSSVYHSYVFVCHPSVTRMRFCHEPAVLVSVMIQIDFIDMRYA